MLKQETEQLKIALEKEVLKIEVSFFVLDSFIEYLVVEMTVSNATL